MLAGLTSEAYRASHCHQQAVVSLNPSMSVDHTYLPL